MQREKENKNIAMENTTPTPEQLEGAEGLVAKAKKNKKALVACSVVLIACVLGALIWIMVAQAGSKKADEAIAKADAALNDSVATALYSEVAEMGYKSGNRAKAEMGIRLYRQEKYKEALEYLNDCTLDDEVAAPGVYALAGDCHVNLGELDQALKSYSKAISAADENPEIVPFILIKEANIYRSQGNYAAEAKAYKEIIDEYPSYVSNTRLDIKKYYERALASQKAE